MLVLTRRTNQSIVIGDDVEVIIVEIRGDQVRLGIKAPAEVTVDRKEVALERAKGLLPKNRPVEKAAT